MTRLLPLCVPFEDRRLAKAAGARWNPDLRRWECREDLADSPGLTPYLPRMYRRSRDTHVLRPWLVPSPLWGKNLRALLPKEQWDTIRRAAYARAGNRCKVCGGVGEQWPVEADEAWAYDDENCIHTLKGVIALCPSCHEVRHWGRTEMEGRSDRAYEHLIYVNRWTIAEADAAIEEAFELWETRSQKIWTSDYSWVERTHGFLITPVGLARADEVHETFPDPFKAPPALSATPDPIPKGPLFPPPARTWINRFVLHVRGTAPTRPWRWPAP